MERVMASHTNKSLECSLDTDRVTTSIDIHSNNTIVSLSEAAASFCPHSAIGLLVHLLELAAPNANLGDTGNVRTR